MHNTFLQAKNNEFVFNGKKIILRGWALGSWMNYEHFMMGLPGSNSMIIDAFERVYGKEHAGEWLDKMLISMVSEEDIRFISLIGTRKHEAARNCRKNRVFRSVLFQ